MRILVVEDDAALASFLKKGLEGEHYAVDVLRMAKRRSALWTKAIMTWYRWI